MSPAVATVTLVCLASAAVHAALAPAHLEQGSPLGVAFVAAAAALVALAAVLVATRGGRPAVAAAVALLSTLVVGYALESGLGGHAAHAHEHGGPGVGGVAAATKAVEVIGIAAGLFLLRTVTTVPPRPRAAVGGPERRP